MVEHRNRECNGVGTVVGNNECGGGVTEQQNVFHAPPQTMAGKTAAGGAAGKRSVEWQKPQNKVERTNVTQ